MQDVELLFKIARLSMVLPNNVMTRSQFSKAVLKNPNLKYDLVGEEEVPNNQFKADVHLTSPYLKQSLASQDTDLSRLDVLLHCSLPDSAGQHRDCRRWFSHVHTARGVCGALNAASYGSVYQDTRHSELFREFFR